MENFLSLGLPEQLVNALNQLNFNTPTPIQAKVIPAAIEGKDILASAQTGTGKTAAFAIPLLSKLMQNNKSCALVMTPTRELAAQVMKVFHSMLDRKNTNVKTALLIGGEAISKQLQQLRANPRLIVGTPGRINDHIMRGTLKMLRDVELLVLDEMDRMLDMGFTPQIDKIIKFLSEKRQTLLLSATIPKSINILSEKYLNQPVRIMLGGDVTKIADNLKQEVFFVSEDDKYNQLTKQLDKCEGSVIVFVKTKFGTEKVRKLLLKDNHSADAIHGDLSHSKREQVINGFRNFKYRIMVATDIAARGLDIAHVRYVINYDLPQSPEDYVHRIGRTARAGAEGCAVCFVTPSDKGKWNAISRLLNPDFKSDGYESKNTRNTRDKKGKSTSRFKKPYRSFKKRDSATA